MHPIVQQFVEKRPRTYGLLVLISASLLMVASRYIPDYRFWFFCLSVVVGVSGILYITLGSIFAKWMAARDATLNPNRLSLRQSLILAAISFAALAFCLVLYSTLGWDRRI